MRRRNLGGLIAACGALLLGSAATAVAAVPAAQITISPQTIGPDTSVVLRFRQPETTGVIDNTRYVESLRVIGPADSGCVTGADVDLAEADQGRMMHPVLRPGHFDGRHWCDGRYTVQLLLYQFPRCSLVPGRACPMIVIVPRVLATAHFRVG